jgi:hypothetical protein
MRVYELKGKLQDAQQELETAVKIRDDAIEKQHDAQRKVDFFKQHVLGTEQVSIEKMREGINELRKRLNDLLAEIGVYRSLNAEIQWRS